MSFEEKENSEQQIEAMKMEYMKIYSELKQNPANDQDKDFLYDALISLNAIAYKYRQVAESADKKGDKRVEGLFNIIDRVKSSLLTKYLEADGKKPIISL